MKQNGVIAKFISRRGYLKDEELDKLRRWSLLDGDDLHETWKEHSDFYVNVKEYIKQALLHKSEF